ncbi:MAG: DUF2298 domain-containing protein [Spirochaetia bacterium]|nr:DUF2298 domain-containing protein [Spirochaetia bacterium]
MVSRKSRRSKAAPHKKSKLGLYFAFGIILFVSMVLRLYQPDWYNDRQFHPDERWIVGNAVPEIKYWGDKPIGMQYGSLPMYILSTYKGLVDSINNSTGHRMDMNRAYIGGARAISGIFDTGTIVFIFLTALLFFGPGTAILAALILGFMPLHIHSAHFFTVDTFTAFFVAGGVYFAARIYKYGRLADYIVAGVLYGMALASKSAAIPMAFAVITAHLMRFFGMKAKTRAEKAEKNGMWLFLAWAAVVAFAAFFICMPHALLDFEKFMQDQNAQKNILITGTGDVPYNRQYINTTPFIFYIKNLVLYTMGIPAASLAWLGIGFYLIAFFKKLFQGKFEHREILLLFSWMIPYFLVVGGSFAKFNRYMLPLTPFLALIAAKFAVDIYNWVKDKKIGAFIMAVVIAGSVFYGLAFMNVYTNSHPWIDASRFMIREVPDVTVEADGKSHRTRVLNEMWGDDLPVHVEGRGSAEYENLKWNLQEPDSPNKLEELSNMLSYTDIVVMADKRAYGTYQRIPQRYPLNYFYYTTMLTNPEKFGYRKIYDKVNYPSLFGITINDDKADESFQLYDHPRVFLFKNEGKKTKDELKALLLQGQMDTMAKFGNINVNTPPREGIKGKKGINNPNIGQARDKVVPVIPQLSIFMWYALIQLFAFMALPLCFTVFRNLKDKGYGLAKVAGLFFFAWINWMLVSLNVWKFYQVNLWILLAALFGVSLYFTMKNRHEFTSFAAGNRKYIIVTESVFLGAYAFFILVKLFTPDIHNIMGHGYNGGGEPMGMAYLSAIFNAVKFPPHDPWLSGFTLNYYYWGQLMLATATKLLGFMPKVTYNLSLSLLFALCAVSAFSLVYNMTGKYKYAALGAFLLACAGNFHTLTWIYEKITSASNLQWLARSLSTFQFIWDPTRIYPSPTITEMPFFSYLYADLHAHNIVIPITLLVLGLVLNIMKADNRGMNVLDSFGKNTADKCLTAGTLAVAVGSMLAINTWNAPGVILVTALALFMLYVSLARGNWKVLKKAKMPERLKQLGYPALVMAGVVFGILALSYAAFLPFHMNFGSPYSRIGFVTGPERASLFMMFEYFAIFFFAIFAYSFLVLDGGFAQFASKTGLLKLKMKKFNMDRIRAHVGNVFDKITCNNALMARFIIACAVTALFFGLLFFKETFSFILIMFSVVTWALVFVKDRDEMFALVLVFLSLGMIAGAELIYVADGRMNTVFKFYMVVWTLMSIAAPYLLFKFVSAFKKQFAKGKNDRIYITSGTIGGLALALGLAFADARTGMALYRAFFIIVVFGAPLAFVVLKDKIGRYILASAMIFLMVPAVIYPVMGSAIKIGICSMNLNTTKLTPGIDGTRYMSKADQRPGSPSDFDRADYGAIEWINNNMPKIEPILEAPGEEMYRGYSRISIFTGMPTLVGWGYQVGQQSGRGDEVAQRNNMANLIYNTPDREQAKNLINKYGIKYVYVGNIERARYGAGADKFQFMYDTVYSKDGAVIYKVQ